MKNMKKNNRAHYSPEFKEQAVKLADDIGVKEAAQKLGVSLQSLGNWCRHAKKLENDSEYREIEELRAEVKKLKKELDVEKRSVAILQDAARFFCLNQEK